MNTKIQTQKTRESRERNTSDFSSGDIVRFNVGGCNHTGLYFEKGFSTYRLYSKPQNKENHICLWELSDSGETNSGIYSPEKNGEFKLTHIKNTHPEYSRIKNIVEEAGL